MIPAARPLRSIAARLLLTTAGGTIEHPLVELTPDGRLHRIVQSGVTTAAADRRPFTEYLAGLLVPDFPRDYRAAFAAVAADRTTPLGRLLPREEGGICVLLTGIDYERMVLTEQTKIRTVQKF